MNHPSARMLELLSLLAPGVPRGGADLAARLGVSPRTLRRDVERLRDLGYRVQSARGTGGSYLLPAGQGVPPLHLSEEEAVTTAVGLRHAAAAYGPDGPGPADTALRKLEQALPARLRGRIEALLAATEVPGGAGPPDGLGTLEHLATATHLRSRVCFRYAARDGGTGERRAEPHRLVLLAHRWYLLAWDEGRAAWRTFRVDRITELRVPGTTFAPRPLPEGSAGLFPGPGAARGAVLFLAPAGAVARRLTARAGTLEPAGRGRCRYLTGTDDWDWLAGALASVGLPYRVEGPWELVRATRALTARAAAAVPADRDQKA